MYGELTSRRVRSERDETVAKSIEVLRKEFDDKGYVVIDDYLSSPEVRQVLDSIEAYRASGREVIQVDQQSLVRTQVFKTIVGDDCEQHIALFGDLWRRRILELSKQLSGVDLLPINDSAIGLNCNITERSGVLSFHYDRNEVTAVLYLQQCSGGALECYPHFRLLLPRRYSWHMKQLQRALDVLWRTPAALWLARKRREFIVPQAGRLVIMRGPLALHRVQAVEEGPNRIAGVFCYDRPEVKWEKWNSTDNYVVLSKKGQKAQSRY